MPFAGSGPHPSCPSTMVAHPRALPILTRHSLPSRLGQVAMAQTLWIELGMEAAVDHGPWRVPTDV
eukprot:7121320-Pyramimonas_sp.AAC.1